VLGVVFNDLGEDMRHRPDLFACVAFLALLGCGDGAVDPGGGPGEELAARFEQLADSVDGEGYSPTADALRHAAEIVRLTGHATPVTLAVDGVDRSFLAVAEQLDFPNIQCSWPGDSGGVAPGDSVVGPTPEPAPPPGELGDCEEVGVYSMRTLIAWEPENMAEVVRIVADLGSTEVQPGVPDVMTGLPTNDASGEDGSTPPEPGDSAGGGGGGSGYPGFIGEYLVRDVGSWWAVEGTQANELLGQAGDCTDDRVTFDWADFSCEAARFRFEFAMRVERMRYDPVTGWDPGPDGGADDFTESHTLALGSSEIAGVRLKVIAWNPPPLPPIDPIPGEPPVDSTGVSPDGTT
jgi:hypothetical protein